MIQAKSISYNPDGTVWVAGTKWWATTIMSYQDRPCDTCNGTKVLGSGWGEHMKDQPCPPCNGIGRHTFDVQVENPRPKGLAKHWVPSSRTYRVSVVPGMVLEVVEQIVGDDCPDAPHVCVFYGRMGGEDYPQWCYYDGDTTEEEVVMPARTTPGMYVVQLLVEQS